MIEISTTPYDASAAWDSAVSLDSAGSSCWDRWSYQPAEPNLILRCDARTLLTTLHSASGKLKQWTDPLAALAWLGAQCDQAPMPGPPFKSGWIGYLSYDLGRLFETLPSRAADDLHLPLFCFTYHHRVIARDHANHCAFDCRGAPVGDPLRFPSTYAVTAAAPRSGFTRAAYESAVARAIEYVAAGDVFQVNLSHRLHAISEHAGCRFEGAAGATGKRSACP